MPPRIHISRQLVPQRWLVTAGVAAEAARWTAWGGASGAGLLPPPGGGGGRAPRRARGPVRRLGAAAGPAGVAVEAPVDTVGAGAGVTPTVKTTSSSNPQTRVDSPPAAKPVAMDSLSHLSELEQMQLLMGFGDFDSTKGKPVQENVKGAAAGVARRETKREYRQYMNRRGGFNRPLDKA